MSFKKRVFHSKPKMTKAQHALEMKMFLAGCRDEILMRTTVDELVARYKVNRVSAEKDLIDAKARRHVG